MNNSTTGGEGSPYTPGSTGGGLLNSSGTDITKPTNKQDMRDRFQDNLAVIFYERPTDAKKCTSNKQKVLDFIESEINLARNKYIHGNAKICDKCMKPMHIHPHDFYDNDLDCNCNN